MKETKISLTDDGKVEIVFNTCYGGFSISKEAILKMIELGSEEAKRYYEEVKSYPYTINSYNPKIPRFDPILVQVVKELKNKASGQCASLAIGKVEIDRLIDIDNHDGKEELKFCYDYKIYGRYEDDE